MNLENIMLKYNLTSDTLQLLGILTALLTSVISIIISIISIRQNTKINKEASMAQIEIFPFKIYGDYILRIRIQNFGKTTGEIIDVEIDNKISSSINPVMNPFNSFIGISLAPNQSYTTVFVRDDCTYAKPAVDEFDVYFEYKTLGKIIRKTCHINFKMINNIVTAQSSAKDAVKALNNINQSIQGLQ